MDGGRTLPRLSLATSSTIFFVQISPIVRIVASKGKTVAATSSPFFLRDMRAAGTGSDAMTSSCVDATRGL